MVRKIGLFVWGLAWLFAALACGLTPARPPEALPTVTPFVNLQAFARQTEMAATQTAAPAPVRQPTATLLPGGGVAPPPPTATLQLPSPQVVPTLTPVLPRATQPAAEVNALPAAAPEYVWGNRYFIPQEGTPVGMANWAHPDLGCNWQGVAGQVFDLNGEPALTLVVEAGGTFNGAPVLGLSVTGITSVYGPGGYEIQLGNVPLTTSQQVWVQLKDGDGKALSEPIFLDTVASCDQNLILLNFVEQPGPPPQTAERHIYLPFIARLGGTP